jgi:hypothetical protein
MNLKFEINYTDENESVAVRWHLFSDVIRLAGEHLWFKLESIVVSATPGGEALVHWNILLQ